MKLFFGNSVGQIIALALYPYIARFYFPADFSSFGFMSSLTMILAVFATGQFHTALLNPDREEEVHSLIGLSTVLVTIFSVVTFIVLFIYDKSLVLVPFYLFVYSLFEIQKMYFIRKKLYSESAYSQIIFRLFGNGAKLLPPAVGLKSNGLILTEIFSLCLVVIYGFKKSVFNFKWDKETFNKYKSFPMFQTFTMAVNLLILDFPILFWVDKFPKEDLGYFVIGQKLIVLPALVVSNAIQNASVHNFLESRNPLSTYLRQTLSVVTLGMICSLIFYFYGGDLLSNILGPKWSNGAHVFGLLSLLVITKLVFATTQATFVLRGVTKRTLFLRSLQVYLLIFLFNPKIGFYESLKFYILLDMTFDAIHMIWAGFIIRPPFLFRQQPK